jgi:hypothetical protein
MPPPILAYEQGSFAAFTIQKRLPKILGDVKRQLQKRHQVDPRWGALEAALTQGGLIDVSLFAADTPYWVSRVAALSGKPWSEQPFFDLEFLFYKAVDTIALDLEPGLDVFASTRRDALVDALPHVARTVESAGALSLEAALLLAVSGNEADLSQLAPSRDLPKSAALVDERAEATERLVARGTDRVVQVLADNAGSELCFDLVLVTTLLDLGLAAAIELQVKPRPMFVSDALAVDVEETLLGFERQPSGTALRHVGQTLRRALLDNRFRIRAPADWAEPRHVDSLEPELVQDLRAAHLVVVKGDLNYRRYFGDRAWPAQTPVEAASLEKVQHAFALRVLKSDCVVGIPAVDAERLFAVEPDWRSNGTHSIIQRIDGGARTR